MKTLSQTTLVELARAGAVRGYTLYGRTDGYVLSVQYGLQEAVLTAKRGGARRFARIDTALALLRTLRAAAVEVRLADAALPPRPNRRDRPAGLAALDGLHAEAAPRARSPRSPQPLADAMPLSIRRAKARAAALLDALEVGETWDAHDAERAFNFEHHWAVLVARAPRGLRAYLLEVERRARDTSPTFARLHRSMSLPNFPSHSPNGAVI